MTGTFAGGRPGTGSAPGPGGGFGGGRFGDGGGPGGGLGGRFGRGLFGDLDAAAAYFGVSTTVLQTDLQNGQTLAQVAKAQGKTVAGLVDAMVAVQKQQLEAAVTAGQLTRAQAQQVESSLTQRVTAIVNGTRPGRGFGPGFESGDDRGRFGGDPGGGNGTFGSATA